MFSFNNPYGACPVCTGLGIQKRVDPEPPYSEPPPFHHRRHSRVRRGGARHRQGLAAMYHNALRKKHAVLRWKRPSRSSPSRRSTRCCTGTGDEPLELNGRPYFGRRSAPAVRGVIPSNERRYRETNSEWSRGEIEEVMSERPCPACHGRRLRPEVLAVTLGRLNIFRGVFRKKSVIKAMSSLHAQARPKCSTNRDDRKYQEIMDRLGTGRSDAGIPLLVRP